MAPHIDTPTKAKLQDAKELLDHFGVKYTNRRLFKYFNISDRTGYRILKDYPRRHQNNPFCHETRGRKPTFSSDQLDTIDQFLRNEGWEARTLPWIALPNAAGVDLPTSPSAKTIRTALSTRGWSKCTACTKFWVNNDTADVRDRFAREQLRQLGLDSENYRHGPEGKVQKIIRQPGERYCTDCIQYRTRPSDSGTRSTNPGG
ncbi:hypothetical protein F5B17DRAFT_111139 [Nemania serpens]|nr:hypothetical protein F5B17DRAFT_111139 [Nemania serpens]